MSSKQNDYANVTEETQSNLTGVQHFSLSAIHINHASDCSGRLYFAS